MKNKTEKIQLIISKEDGHLLEKLRNNFIEDESVTIVVDGQAKGDSLHDQSGFTELKEKLRRKCLNKGFWDSY